MPESINVPHPAPAVVSTTFPQEIEVTLVLKLTVEDQDERDEWLEPGTFVIKPDALADVFDIFDINYSPINSINNFTKAQLQAILQART